MSKGGGKHVQCFLSHSLAKRLKHLVIDSKQTQQMLLTSAIEDFINKEEKVEKKE